MPDAIAFGGEDLILHLTANIDGAEEAARHIRGFAGVSDAIKFEENQEVVNAREGMDGYIFFSRTGRYGGMMTIKMLPNSPEIGYLMVRHYAQKTGNKNVTWKGTVELKGTNISGDLRIGKLTHGPTFPTVGMNNIDDMQFAFYFARIEAKYEGVDFDVYAGDLTP